MRDVLWTPVPLFYLNLGTGAEFVEDGEGVELSDSAAARCKAIVGLRDVLAGDVRSGLLNTACYIEIENEKHELVTIVGYDDVLTIEGSSTQRGRDRAIFAKLGPND